MSCINNFSFMNLNKFVNTTIPERNSPMLLASHSDLKLNDITFCSRQALLNAKKTLLSCPDAKDLYRTVKAEKPFKIKCGSIEKVPFGALMFPQSREIFISYSENMVSSLLFELNNMKRSEIAVILNQNKCKFSPEQYAELVLAIEHNTAKDSEKITKSCIEGGFWDKNHEQIFQSPDSFKEFLETSEQIGTAKNYRSVWHEQCFSENDWSKMKQKIEL